MMMMMDIILDEFSKALGRAGSCWGIFRAIRYHPNGMNFTASDHVKS